MTHDCNTPSRYTPQIVYGGYQCRVCGQRWINTPTSPYEAEWVRVSRLVWFMTTPTGRYLIPAAILTPALIVLDWWARVAGVL